MKENREILSARSPTCLSVPDERLGQPNVHFLSRTSEWPTPKWFFEELDREFHFSLDPCSTDENAKCLRHFIRKDNGLTQDWSSDVVFMNPPYGREISDWMQKAWESALEGATVVCLVPARTDTRWWHTFAIRGEIRFLRGRLKFEGAMHCAPFPSAIVVFRPSSIDPSRSSQLTNLEERAARG
jgi:phage N-6-adenine-methyltransferase